MPCKMLMLLRKKQGIAWFQENLVSLLPLAPTSQFLHLFHPQFPHKMRIIIVRRSYEPGTVLIHYVNHSVFTRPCKMYTFIVHAYR